MGGVTRRPLEAKDLDNDCGRGDWGVLTPSRQHLSCVVDFRVSAGHTWFWSGFDSRQLHNGFISMNVDLAVQVWSRGTSASCSTAGQRGVTRLGRKVLPLRWCGGS